MSRPHPEASPRGRSCWPGPVLAGVLAGLAGTVAMDAVTALDRALTGRAVRRSPVTAVENLLEDWSRSPHHGEQAGRDGAGGEAAAPQESSGESSGAAEVVLRYGYGATWGIVRGLLGRRESSAWGASVSHLLLLTAIEYTLVPLARIGSAGWARPPGETARVWLGHLAYSAVCSTLYHQLDGRDGRRAGGPRPPRIPQITRLDGAS